MAQNPFFGLQLNRTTTHYRIYSRRAEPPIPTSNARTAISHTTVFSSCMPPIYSNAALMPNTKGKSYSRLMSNAARPPYCASCSTSFARFFSLNPCSVSRALSSGYALVKADVASATAARTVMTIQMYLRPSV